MRFFARWAHMLDMQRIKRSLDKKTAERTWIQLICRQFI